MNDAQELCMSRVIPQPTPCLHQVYRVEIGSHIYVAIKFDDQTGSKVLYYPPSAAKELADTIKATAAGLTLVTQQPTTIKDGTT